MQEDVKIIYCYDENGNSIHYSKTTKGNKYFCIDCGSELICKDGDIKVKHLAHKNTDNCGGTGESIFHKHWKENLFKAGMFINIANKLRDPENVEILDVINEVPLSERYGKTWDREIFVDVLLVTEKGDIVVEINYKNPKNWNELKPYYKELDMLRVFEVKVDKNVDTQLEWRYLGEEEETKQIKKEIKEENKNIKIRDMQVKEEQRIIKEKKKAEKQMAKIEAQEKKWNDIVTKVKDGTYVSALIFMNFKTPLKCVGDGVYEMKCLFNKDNIKHGNIKLRFRLKKLDVTKAKIERDFKITKGIKRSKIIFEKTQSDDGYYEVVSFDDVCTYEYDNVLFAKLCNIK